MRALLPTAAAALLLLAALAAPSTVVAAPRRLLAKASSRPPVDNPPQFIVFTHDDGVASADLKAVLSATKGHKNPNGCAVPVTWFACTKGCSGFDCESAKSLYDRGHELADHTVDHKHMRSLTPSQVKQQIVGARSAIAACGIPADSIAGFRTPFLEDSPAIRKALSDAGFRYDSSVGQGGGKKRLWPARVSGGMPYDCSVAGNKCSKSEDYPSLWEVPLYSYPGGNTMDPCTNENTGDRISGCSAYSKLKGAFDAAYGDGGNRGPVEVSAHTPFLQKFGSDVNKFLGYALAKPDVWAVTMSQLLDWMAAPVPTSGMEAFMGQYQCAS